jgi:type IV pilus assembly protein PilF
MIAEQRGKAAEAGTHYAKAMELAPARGALLNNYGAWLCGNGRAAESLVLFDRALADPGYRTPGAALANAGSCALTAGQAARADRDLRRALQYDPANPTALAALAELEYGAGDYMQARAFSERRLAAAPATLQVLQLASQIEQKLGDTAAAARYVQRIRTEFPQARTPSGDVGR